MGQSIFDIEKQYLEVIDILETNGGEITDDIAELLEITEEDFKAKMATYGAAIITMEQEIILADGQIEKFQKKKKAKQATINRLESIMLQAVKLMGEYDPKSKAKNPTKQLVIDQFKFSIRETKTVEVDPIKFNLIDDRIYPYAKVKLSLELTPEEYFNLKTLKYYPTVDINKVVTKESINILAAFTKIQNCVITVQPDKRALIALLKEDEEKKTLGPELDFDAMKEVLTDIVEGENKDNSLIPGVKLIINESLQIK
jgi:hypothetical protein